MKRTASWRPSASPCWSFSRPPRQQVNDEASPTATPTGGKTVPRYPKEGPPPPPDGYVWSDEAARRLSLSRRTLWNYRHTGQGPKAKRYRGRLVYAIDAIEAYKKAELE